MFLLLASLARGADVDVGVGVRDAQNQYVSPFGARAFGRATFAERFGVEAGVYAAFPHTPTGDLTGLTLTLLQIGMDQSNFSTPIDREAGSLELLGIASPWKQPHERQLTLWPTVTAGATAIVITHWDASSGPEGNPVVQAAKPAWSLEFGPVVGVTFEAFLADRFGLRLEALQRFYVDLAPNYQGWDSQGNEIKPSNQLYHPTAVNLDVVVRL